MGKVEVSTSENQLNLANEKEVPRRNYEASQNGETYNNRGQGYNDKGRGWNDRGKGRGNYKGGGRS